MQVSEQDLFGTQHRAFAWLRLLDLDDEFAGRKHRRRIGRNCRAGADVVLVLRENSGAGATLNYDAVPVMDELGHALRG